MSASVTLACAVLGLWTAPESPAADDPSPAAPSGWGRPTHALPPDAALVAVLPRPIPWAVRGEPEAAEAYPVLVGGTAAFGGPDADAQIGRGLTVPSGSSGARGGFDGKRLHASIAYLAPEAVQVGIFYPISDRFTVGLVGQRLKQERTVRIEGQLVDPNDLRTFVPGFTIREEISSISVGPFAQVHVFPEKGPRPEISVAAYSMEWGAVTSASTHYSMPNLMIRAAEDAAATGESADKYRTVFVSASKSLPWFRNSTILRGVRAYGGAGYGARTGKRYAVAATGSGDPRVRVTRDTLTRTSFVGWAGAEVSLPAHLSIYGEVFTGDECDAGYAAGLRWNSPIGITFTLGVSNCLEPIAQRALDLLYLPGGVGGQPSLVKLGGGFDGGGSGYRPKTDED